MKINSVNSIYNQPPLTRQRFMLIRFCIVLVALLGLSFTLAVQADISNRKAVQKFIQTMVKDEGFDQAELIALFEQVEIKQKIIDAMSRPAEGVLPWYKYRGIFLKKDRINGGVEFWEKNQETLAAATEKYGIPSEIIVAIIGVESKYGRHKGKYRVMDAISSLAFDFPKRSKFFTKELKEYLLMTREENIEPLSILGSYAGAMGKPQFIPSSYRAYAVDFDGDGQRDLIHSTEDVIGSVANYFKRHHWQSGKPVIVKARLKTYNSKTIKKLVKKGIRPHSTLKTFAKKDIVTWKKMDEKSKAALIELEYKKGKKQYWLGLKNFYVITRYNHSQLYAMAVYQLSQEILKGRKTKLAQNK
ncbi:MAG: lytic murein transglycosylase B [Thiohalomonadales bacterium]